MARRLGFLTSARSDFGLLLPLIEAAMADQRVAVTVFAAGSHFARDRGFTISEVRASLPAELVVELPTPSPAAADGGTGAAMGLEVAALAREFARNRPDLLVVLGDRLDMLPAVVAAVPATIPIAHLCGGERSEGVIDDAIRHAVTKFAHLHFPAMPEYGDRIRRMGEEPWRIVVTGQPGLDVFRTTRFRSRAEFCAGCGLEPARPLSAFTFHPETLASGQSARDIGEVMAAAADIESQILMTYPNADPGSEAITAALHRFAASRRDCRVVPHLGRRGYLDLLHAADCLVGNSSSGIIEAASVRLPVVDIGDRQLGRIAPPNVLHAPLEREAIAAAWRRALDPEFRLGLAGLVNPYGDGFAVPRILHRLIEVPLDRALLVKRFCD